MVNKSRNPFIYGRIENERNSTLYLTPSILGYLNRLPILFTGIRGSGKTSILKLLSWEVAWKVSERQIFGNKKDIQEMFGNPKHIGVKIRFEDMDIGYWETWKNVCGEDCAQKYFGTYVEMLLLDCFLNAIQKIRQVSKKYFLDVKAEESFVKEMINVCIPSDNFHKSLYIYSFETLRSIISNMHKDLRQLVYKKFKEESISKSFPIVSPGEIIQSFGKSFIENYRSLSDWILMPLLDDCHVLTEWQTKVINSSIVKSQTPIAYKLTSVRHLYKTKLNINNRMLSEHDLKIIDLSYSGPRDKEYKFLVKGVCQSRISQFHGKKYSFQFDVEKFLGKFDIEKLLEIKFENSENKNALELLKKARLIAKQKQKPISITSTWLSEKKIRHFIEIENEETFIQKRMIRRIESSYKIKFRYVAAAAICKEFHFDFPYSGWGVLLNLSNESIREFLRMMYEIWEKAALDIDKFVKQKPLQSRIQVQGIKKASELSFNSIDSKTLNREVSLPKIFERLGNLFSQFQSYPHIIVNSESASIKFKLTENDTDIMDIIKESVMSGFMLIDDKEEDDKIPIGLHPILAPKFGIVFRKPFYYSEYISTPQIRKLFWGSKKDVIATSNQILMQRLTRYNKNSNKNIKYAGKKFKIVQQIEINFNRKK